MTTQVVEKSFCTTKEAATLLGVSVGTVQLWVESGLLQAWKTAGGHRRVLRDSVERLLHRAPQAPAASSPPGGGAAPAASGTGPLRVIVVEDDQSLQRLYEVQIGTWPMATEVQVCGDGFVALLAVGRASPDLLITDLRMPGMDGFRMLRALQESPEVADTRIVVVSGLQDSEIAAQGGLPAGIELLPKPVPFERLRLIAGQVQSRRTQLAHAGH